MSKKIPKSHFILEEENGIVTASMRDEHEADLSLQLTITDMPHPRVRAPRRSKAQIESDSKYFSVIEHKTQEEYLMSNIKGVRQEINKQVQEIRKTIKRMQSLTHYVVTAQEVLDEIK